MSEELNVKSKILIADDDASMRRFIEVTLRRAGYETVVVEDGLQAMQTAMSSVGGGAFDAIIADAVMPNLTGYDLCRMLRQNPTYKNVPLVILSGMTTNENDGQCLADAYLTKSENLKQELTETLARLLTEKKTVS